MLYSLAECRRYRHEPDRASCFTGREDSAHLHALQHSYPMLVAAFVLSLDDGDAQARIPACWRTRGQ